MASLSHKREDRLADHLASIFVLSTSSAVVPATLDEFVIHSRPAVRLQFMSTAARFFENSEPDSVQALWSMRVWPYLERRNRGLPRPLDGAEHATACMVASAAAPGDQAIRQLVTLPRPETVDTYLVGQLLNSPKRTASPAGVVELLAWLLPGVHEQFWFCAEAANVLRAGANAARTETVRVVVEELTRLRCPEANDLRGLI